MTHHAQDELLAAVAPLVDDLFAPRRRACRLPPVPGGFAAVLAWLVRSRAGVPVLWICDGPATLETRHRDFLSLAPPDGFAATGLLYYPEWESLPDAGARQDVEISGQRLTALMSLRERTTPPLVATCVQALMQRTMAPAQLSRLSVTLKRGETTAFNRVVARLVEAGYVHAVEVQEKGRVAVRGGVLDVWSPSDAWPVRIEFFGDDVESLRHFDPVTQRSRDVLEDVSLPPASELGEETDAPPTHGLLDYLPADTVFVWDDLSGIEQHAEVFEEALAEQGASDLAEPFPALRKRILGRRRRREVYLGGEDDGGMPDIALDVRPTQHVLQLKRSVLDPDVMEAERQRLLEQLAAWAADGWSVLAFFDTDGGRSSLGPRLEKAGQGGASVGLVTGPLSEGFVCETLRVAVVTEGDIVGARKRRVSRYDPQRDAAKPDPHIGQRVADLSGLEPGDLVVHSEHGLGLYRGLSDIVVSGQQQEVLTIEYADEAKLHVPVTHAHLLSRYVGATRHSPRLHRLGSKRWGNEKQAAQEAVADLAASLLETQARRSALKGRALPPDTPWQREFELLFPYQETPDQVKAIRAVKADLESPHPCDRLICGDAGYGKTEVAMRAAFKTVMAGQQVALLVPTTVLAQQHYETFLERMAAFPLRIEMLSRFRSQGQRARTVAGLRDGTVDIVIGTHALVQPSIMFKQLGLVIIDEEQRFGVKHKEQLKQVRAMVDVVTMTATPIPRTLYLSLTGARDMSLIQTAPRERMAIDTIVTRNSDKVIRRAVLRELNREGQVFYLHNRVMTIDRVAQRLHRVVPEARVAVAHGQMAAGELSRVMHAFVSGDYDVLVCTTIVESGVDIPRVNTILIDRADRFGIADLYQLRGRVGRSSHKAYAYLLLPVSGPVDSDARRRINAIKKYSHLGAGFSLALQDLEIRGAGNILGARQSGHIAAVGFGLYCQLLRRTVARLQGEPVPALVETEVRIDFVTLSPTRGDDSVGATLPYDYIDDEAQRVAIYNRLAQCVSVKDVTSVSDDLRDRFGLVPDEGVRLFKIAELRVEASDRGLSRVEVVDNKVRLLKGADYVMPGGRFPRLGSAAPDDRIDELLAMIKELPFGS